MRRYLETLEMLEREPGKWLGRGSVRHIKMFLSGLHCREVTGNNTAFDALTPFLNGFSMFLAAKYCDSYLDYSDEVALSEAAYDDDGSFTLYFSEWRAYYESWSQTGQIVNLGNVQSPVIDLSTTLNRIRARPGMYFAGPSVELLYSYIRGIQRCCECYAPGAKVVPNFTAYEAWLSSQAPQKKLCRWDRLLLAEHGFDETRAMERFFESLDEFRGLSPEF